MYLGPGEQLWLDAWVPRDDPLWAADVSVAAEWVGAWWIEALAGIGQQGFVVHRGRSVPGAFGDLVCFAGRGPGEVFHGAAKVVGLSQWRARQGALFSSCAYLRWDPAPLLALVDVDEAARAGLAATWRRVGWVWPSWSRRPPTSPTSGGLLLDSFPSFSVTRLRADPFDGFVPSRRLFLLLSTFPSFSDPPDGLPSDGLPGPVRARRAPRRTRSGRGGASEPPSRRLHVIGTPRGFQLRCSGSEWLCSGVKGFKVARSGVRGRQRTQIRERRGRYSWWQAS